jgi:indolepyruvate ferredoxin oxidoreductase
MKSIDKRFLAQSGQELFNGNELLIKGAFETLGGVNLITGYPGSPIASFFDQLGHLSDVVKEHGLSVRIANNEAIAVAMVNGSQMLPLRSLCAFKSVGGHVASDALAISNLAGANPKGGAVIVFGDDPWSESTQVPSDSRYLCQHLRMPVLEPSNPQETKDFIPLAFRLSEASGLYIGYILTTLLADGGSTVTVSENHWPEKSINNPSVLQTSELDLENTVLLPPRTGRKEVEMPQRYEKLIAECRKADVNKIFGSAGRNKVGFIVCGVAYQYLMDVLDELDLADKFPILKMGITYPLDDKLVAEFASRLDHVVVVEERRAFLETQVAEVLTRARQLNPSLKFANVWGKKFPGNHEGFPAALGLHPSMVLDRIIKLIRLIDPALHARYASKFEVELAKIRKTTSGGFKMISRTPAFCPGCPHRNSASTFLEIRKNFMDPAYMRKHHHMSPVDLLFHGDTGCYTLLMFPPNEQLMHDYSAMGLGGGTGAGIDPFIKNKQVVFLGDSTFFHSGMIAISNAIKQRQDITYIILDNRTTAMTGHQPTPGVERDVLGDITPRQNIDAIVKSITAPGHCPVIRANPADRKKYKNLLEKTVLRDGVKIIIADKECGIVSHRRKLKAQREEQRHTGFLARETFMNITPELCEYCLQCTTTTGCPGLNVEQTPYGPKTTTDLSWCVNDGACAQIKACPSFEEVVVLRNKPPRPRGHQIKLEKLPSPKSRFSGSVWRCHLAGVGGMGIGLASAILSRAGEKEGYKVIFSDKKGMAIRNGGTYSQITFHKDNIHYSQNLPYGSADLLIGLDILEAARALDPLAPFRIANPEKTTAVLNIDKTPTILTLCNREDFDPNRLQEIIRNNTRPDGFFAHNITNICERIFGTKLYANLTMLGLAYQQGLIPVSIENIEDAISQTVKADFKKNMRAFNLGRKLAAHPDLFAEKQEPKTIARIVREKANILLHTRFNGDAFARQYKFTVYSALRACRELDRETMRAIALRIYDLVNYQNFSYAMQYIDIIKAVYRRDRKDYDFAVTQSVVWNLYKLMLVKDEFWVAHILTSYEKTRHDHHRYNVNPANGDRIRYKRTFHPRFFGKMISIPMPHFAMYIMREFKFLRSYLPFFHLEDRKFLNWYRDLLAGFSYRSEREYFHYLSAIKAVDQVKGYREYRTPTMIKAHQEAEDSLSSLPLNPHDGGDSDAGNTFRQSTFTWPDRTLSGATEPRIINKLVKIFKSW